MKNRTANGAMLAAPLILATILALVDAPPSLSAQSTTSSDFNRVPHNAELRLRVRNHSLVYERFTGVTVDSVALGQPFGSDRGQIVPLRDVTAAWYRHGWQTAKGLVLGAGIGVGVGLALGAVVHNTGDLTRGQLMVSWSSILGLAGGLSGLIARGLTQRWDRLPTS